MRTYPAISILSRKEFKKYVGFIMRFFLLLFRLNVNNNWTQKNILKTLFFFLFCFWVKWHACKLRNSVYNWKRSEVLGSMQYFTLVWNQKKNTSLNMNLLNSSEYFLKFNTNALSFTNKNGEKSLWQFIFLFIFQILMQFWKFLDKFYFLFVCSLFI